MIISVVAMSTVSGTSGKCVLSLGYVSMFLHGALTHLLPQRFLFTLINKLLSRSEFLISFIITSCLLSVDMLHLNLGQQRKM